MKIITKVFKGTLIGLGSILPGVSGGMIAAAFNIYEDLVSALSNIVKTPIKAFLSIWEYLIGIGIGILLGVIVIATVFKAFPIPITLLFIGLILGGIPSLIKDIKNERKKWFDYLIMIIMIILMISALLLKPGATQDVNLFEYALIGLLIAIPLIVPGLSGTMILMSLGLYTGFIDVVYGFINELFKFNISSAFTYVPKLTIMGITVLVSLFIISKLISYVLKKHRISFNMAILGILVVSPINILWSLYLDVDYTESFSKIGPWTIVVSIILLVFGCISAYLMANKSRKEELVDEVENK